MPFPRKCMAVVILCKQMKMRYHNEHISIATTNLKNLNNFNRNYINRFVFLETQIMFLAYFFNPYIL